jgi:hypothetical protein
MEQLSPNPVALVIGMNIKVVDMPRVKSDEASEIAFDQHTPDFAAGKDMSLVKPDVFFWAMKVG